MRKKEVVLIDDDETLVQLITFALEQRGFTVHSFAKGAVGKEYLLNKSHIAKTELLILDRMLPDMDGIDILKALEKKFPGAVPVLILSALSSEKEILKGLSRGAVDYVGKPFSVPVLVSKVLTLTIKK
ncbi:MAG TPA: response regulator [Chlamydiales bacterium]|nr:MAG: hypothetical protein A3F67_09405 [Verrucomicrobia bacterium RIFCSPHIGHO2_12_FULL_41_10]HLB52295.1 response regulator [Chlamydiales bacterium]